MPIHSTHKTMKVNLAIFASGQGSNARSIMEHFKGHAGIRVALVVSNKKDAGVLEIAQEMGVATHVTTRAEFQGTSHILQVLQSFNIQFVILAGFLWLIPEGMVNFYLGKMVNIHPSLLPKYGGKGMYGHKVHQAVVEAGEQESGMTIHWVDAQFDEGGIIFQARCRVLPGDEAKDLAARVLLLEHQHYAATIERLVKDLFKDSDN